LRRDGIYPNLARSHIIISPDRLAKIAMTQRNLMKRDSTIKYMTTPQINELNPVDQAVNSDSVPSLVKRCVCVSIYYHILCCYILCQNVISKSFGLYIFVLVVVRNGYLLEKIQ